MEEDSVAYLAADILPHHAPFSGGDRGLHPGNFYRLDRAEVLRSITKKEMARQCFMLSRFEGIEI
jgi:hypothetical protein